MNLKRIIYIVCIILLIIVGSNYIGKTYSKYETTSTSSGDTQIAKWAVNLKDGSQELEKKFNITFVSETNNNGNVAQDKIAPGNSVKAALILDLTNTEVAVDYNITVYTKELENQIGTSNISLTMLNENSETIELGKDNYIPLVNNEKFTETNGVFTFNFYLSWDNNYDRNNSSDTNVALNYNELTLPVNVKIKQHIEDSNYAEEEKKITSNISYAETTATKQRQTQSPQYTYNDQDVLSVNPEKGFYSTSGISLNESGLVNSSVVTKSNTTNLLYLKVNLSAFSGSMNGTGIDKELTPEAISAFAAQLEAIKQNNNTIILRFVYDDNATGIIEGKEKFEPEQDMILTHIRQLSSTLKKYASTINVIQIGFYGLWGENAFNTTITSHPEYYQQTTQALLDATSGTDITIALRTPSYYTHYRGIDISNIVSDVTTSSEDAYRVGIFNDGYGGSFNDLGTYIYSREVETNWLHNQSAHTFFGGEAVVDVGYNGSNPSSAIRCI